ncbi:MAG: hypothetical protein JXA77_13825 [Bacteroidales bacterium]|nr:hypothetical protein [Bacteroidales bacterium]MBN2819181.1 hypothetical protein [Bacteroidales bacterium]
MARLDFFTVIREAWASYDGSMKIKAIFDVSAQVSTNHVFKVTFEARNPVFAKLSYYGKYEHFHEDHIIINNLANNLEAPYDNFLARSLVKKNDVFIYRYMDDGTEAWVIFYNPIRIKKKMPRRLNNNHIVQMGHEMALFHKACMNVRNTLPESSKTLTTDINFLTCHIEGPNSRVLNGYEDMVRKQCDTFLENIEKLNYESFPKLPVFVDWNIGNFSVTHDGKFHSRWDYDWFRVSSRVLDFYFFSRVVSDIGDRTVFSYVVETFTEERFEKFLLSYHNTFPLSYSEILFLKEAYRFFILNYVIKDGRHFFNEVYANKLQKEAYEVYFPELDKRFNAEKLLKVLKI